MPSPCGGVVDLGEAWIEAPDDEAYDLVIDVAAGRADLTCVASALTRWH